MTQELLDRIETLVKENSSLHLSLREVSESFRAHKEETQKFQEQIGGAAFNRAEYENTLARNEQLEDANLELRNKNDDLTALNKILEDNRVEAAGRIERLQFIIEEIKREIAVKEASYSSMIDQLKLQVRTLTDANKSTTDVHGDSPSSS